MSRNFNGGSAETVKAQSALGQLIRTGLDRIWAAYVEHKRVDELDLYDKIPPISEAQLALVEKAHDLLTEDQYQLANMILFHMKMSRIGNDEMAGWEFADQLVPECFETLCIEFADNIWQLPVESILKKSVVDLLNVLSFDNHIDYEEKRMCEGRVNGVLTEIVNGIVEFVKGAEGGIITKQDWEFRACLESEEPFI